MKNQSNPFFNRNPSEVWKELLQNSKPISKAEGLSRMKEAAEVQKEEKSQGDK
jgi:hypothetical protein